MGREAEAKQFLNKWFASISDKGTTGQKSITVPQLLVLANGARKARRIVVANKLYSLAAGEAKQQGLGKHSEEILDIKLGTALLLAAQGMHRQAIVVFKEAVAGSESCGRAYGPGCLVSALSGLATSHMLLGEHAKAEPCRSLSELEHSVV